MCLNPAPGHSLSETTCIFIKTFKTTMPLINIHNTFIATYATTSIIEATFLSILAALFLTTLVFATQQLFVCRHSGAHENDIELQYTQPFTSRDKGNIRIAHSPYLTITPKKKPLPQVVITSTSGDRKNYIEEEEIYAPMDNSFIYEQLQNTSELEEWDADDEEFFKLLYPTPCVSPEPEANAEI